MTTEELRSIFNDRSEYSGWPEKLEVDADTYGNVCQSAFNHILNTQTIMHKTDKLYFITVSLGPNNGIMFKGVELILKESK